MQKPKISIIIINFNGEAFLEQCLESIAYQAYDSKEIFCIDNASTDGSKAIIQKYPQVKLIKNKENLGYSKAANQGIRMSKSDYVMIMNPDAILEKNYLTNILKEAEKDKKIAALTGKLLKYDAELHKKTNIIDSTGLFCFRNRRIIDRGQGLEDKGQYDKPEEIFGVSGACPVYRRTALEEVKVGEEYFDEDFFMYKEDIDLSWRLQLFGYKAFYVPQAIAYHARGTGVLKRFTHIEVLKSRRNLSRFQKGLAYTNQRLMQIKNELPQHFFHDAPQILWKELLIFGYILLREPYLLKSLIKLLTKIPSVWKKRKIIMARRRVTVEKMRRWFLFPACR